VQGADPLSETILRLSRCTGVDGICELAASAVYNLLPKAYVIVTLYDPEVGAIRWRCDRGLGPHDDFLKRLVGPNRTERTFDHSAAAGGAAADAGGRLIAYPGGLFELLGGRFRNRSAPCFAGRLASARCTTSRSLSTASPSEASLCSCGMAPNWTTPRALRESRATPRSRSFG
jgi:hypothetical protein